VADVGNRLSAIASNTTAALAASAQYLGANFVWWRTTGRTISYYVTHEVQDLYGHAPAWPPCTARTCYTPRTVCTGFATVRSELTRKKGIGSSELFKVHEDLRGSLVSGAELPGARYALKLLCGDVTAGGISRCSSFAFPHSLSLSPTQKCRRRPAAAAPLGRGRCRSV
jgi:hypothetical protein